MYTSMKKRIKGLLPYKNRILLIAKNVKRVPFFKKDRYGVGIALIAAYYVCGLSHFIMQRSRLMGCENLRFYEPLVQWSIRGKKVPKEALIYSIENSSTKLTQSVLL
jgi:hypothetical protein